MGAIGPADGRSRERRLFLVTAVLFVLVVLAGFARTYYFRGFLDGPPVPSRLVHLHGLVMSAWVLLFATQVYLVRAHQVALHRKLGAAGMVLAALVVVVGVMTAIAAGRDGSGSFPPGIPPLAFMAVPLFDMLMMVILVGGALYYRRNPANHKRLMLLAVINLLPPALGRLPVQAFHAMGPLFFFGVPAVLALAAVAWDRRQSGSFNRAFVAGTLALIASYPIRMAVSATPAWTRFAEWLTGASS